MNTLIRWFFIALNQLNEEHKKTLPFTGEFSSLTITIFPSFKIKTNEILQRVYISNIAFKHKKCREKSYYFF